MIPTIDNPAIPQQFRQNTQDAITFAEQALRGACGTYEEFAGRGAVEAAERAQADVYAAMKLLAGLFDVAEPPVHAQPIIEWKFNDTEYEHEVWINGEYEIAHRRRDVCEIKLNEHLERLRRVERKNWELHGIGPELTTPAALVASLDEDNDPITDEEIEAEIGFALRNERPEPKEPYVKNEWDKASAVFRIQMKDAGIPQRETEAMKVARLAMLTRWAGRTITSTKDMYPHELLGVAEALRTGDITTEWELSPWGAMPAKPRAVA